jgi:hypothetical protein
MEETYYIKSGEEIIGPLEGWEVLALRQNGQIQKEDRMSTYKRYSSWDKCETVEDYEEVLDEVGREIKKPHSLILIDILDEMEFTKNQAVKIKWACRSVALFLAVIVFFGVKLTFQ